MDNKEQAAKEIMELCQRILELAPAAGLYVGIKITAAPNKENPNG